MAFSGDIAGATANKTIFWAVFATFSDWETHCSIHNLQSLEFGVQLETFNLKVSEHYRRAESLPQVTLRLPQRPAS